MLSLQAERRVTNWDSENHTPRAEALDQHATGRGTRGSSSSAPTGVPGEVSAGRFACDRNARESQLPIRLGRAHLRCSRIRRGRSFPLLPPHLGFDFDREKVVHCCLRSVDHDSVYRTWQRMICEMGCRVMLAQGGGRWVIARCAHGGRGPRQESFPATLPPATAATLIPPITLVTAVRRGRPGSLPPTRELFRVGRDSVEPGEERDALRNQPGKLAQDRGTLLDRELDQGDVLLGPPPTEHAVTGDTSVEHPVSTVQPGHDVAMIIDGQERNRRRA